MVDLYIEQFGAMMVRLDNELLIEMRFCDYLMIYILDIEYLINL